uniref:OTU domain-containing protein n=1 Tax=Panagrolaimus sp. JU765 TaxID=591449 RepID=A0AC34RB02_9BILA
MYFSGEKLFLTNMNENGSNNDEQDTDSSEICSEEKKTTPNCYLIDQKELSVFALKETCIHRSMTNAMRNNKKKGKKKEKKKENKKAVSDEMQAIFDSAGNFAQLQENKASDLFKDNLIKLKSMDEFIEYLKAEINISRYPLDVFLWNMRSIYDFTTQKYLMLKTLAEVCESTIFCITESKLDHTKVINLSDFGNHEIIRCDRNVKIYGRGGGICCFLPKKFDFTIRLSGNFDEFQILCIDLFPTRFDTLRLIIVYVRENKLKKKDYQQLFKMLKTLTNIEYVTRSLIKVNDSGTPYEKFLFQFTCNKSFTQYVKHPTCKKEGKESLLDLVLTNDGLSISNLIYFPYDFSDHKALKFQVFLNQNISGSRSFDKDKKHESKKEESEDIQFNNSNNETPQSKSSSAGKIPANSTAEKTKNEQSHDEKSNDYIAYYLKRPKKNEDHLTRCYLETIKNELYHYSRQGKKRKTYRCQCKKAYFNLKTKKTTGNHTADCEPLTNAKWQEMKNDYERFAFEAKAPISNGIAKTETSTLNETNAPTSNETAKTERDIEAFGTGSLDAETWYFTTPTSQQLKTTAEKLSLIYKQYKYSLEQQKVNRLVKQRVDDCQCRLVEQTVNDLRHCIPDQVESIKGDGHCGYRSLSFCLTGTQEYHGLVRMAICGWIINNKDSYPNFYEVYTDALQKIRDFKMKADVCLSVDSNYYMEEFDMQAAAIMLNINIAVHAEFDGKNNWNLYGANFPQTGQVDHEYDKSFPTIIFRHTKDHFDAVKSVKYNPRYS